MLNNKILLSPIHLMPSKLVDKLFILACNSLLAPLFSSEFKLVLNNKVICLRFSDIGHSLFIKIVDGEIKRENSQQWNARITGQRSDFFDLATRRVDADTLFFQRRLKLEGETEVGLFLKNFLDSLDFNITSIADARKHATDIAKGIIINMLQTHNNTRI